MSTTFESDDLQLIEKFVRGSNQLLSSSQVRMEATGIISQIITKSGEISAIMYLQSKPRTVLVKVGATYTEQLTEQLQKQNFVLMGLSKRIDYLEYHYYTVPAEYKTWYTEPGLLWKKWWPTERFQNKQRFNLNILVQIKDNWYPVQNIVIDAGVFIIKTLVGQIQISRYEKMLWLSQITPENVVSTAATADDAWGRSPEVRKESTKQQVTSMARTTPTVSKSESAAELVKLQELEKRLHQQQQATIIAEQRAMTAEQRLAGFRNQLRPQRLKINESC